MRSAHALLCALPALLACSNGGGPAPATPEFAYAIASGTESWPGYAHRLAAFEDGSYVTTGAFVGPAVLGAGEPGETILDGVSAADMYVARYHADGALDWAREASGLELDVGRDIATLPDGSIVVVGHFWGDIEFEGGSAGNTSIETTGNADLFVARYAPDGDLLWIKTATGPDHEYATAVAAFPDGSVVVVGGTGTALFGAGEPNETAVPNDGFGFTMFVARYGPDGSLAWVRWRQRGGWAFDVAAFPDGTAVVSTRFGTRRHAADGSLLWEVPAPAGSSLCAMGDGGFLAAGTYRGEITLGAGEPNETTLSSPSTEGPPYRGFYARYQADGTLQWARSLTVPGFGSSNSGQIAARSDGSFVIGGGFVGSASFGEGSPRETTLTGINDAYVASFDAAGRFEWVRHAAAETDLVVVETVALDGNDSILVAGSVIGRAAFGEFEFEGFGPLDPLFMQPVPEGFAARLR